MGKSILHHLPSYSNPLIPAARLPSPTPPSQPTRGALHTNHRPPPQRPSNLIYAPLPPHSRRILIQRMHEPVLVTLHKLIRFLRRRSGNDVNFGCERGAERIEWEVVDVVAEGVLNLVADGGEAQDDVCGDCALLLAGPLSKPLGARSG
jgi:hypothetical protein